jgi:RNA-directed DNA polymerase
MTKRPLEALFKAMYHDRFDYSDFMRCNARDNCEVSQVDGHPHPREILKPNKRLKAYQKFLSLFLFDLLPVNERVVFSYRKGVGVYDAVAPHAMSKHFFQTDIEGFFTSVDSDMVQSIMVSGKDLLPIADFDNHVEHILSLVCVDGRLPTGFSTSPAITNAVLKPFDDLLEARCGALDLRVSRYSDDIILSAHNNSAIYEARDLVESALTEIFAGKFVLNRAKSRHFKAGGRVQILGLMILPNGQISIDAKRRSEIEVLLHFYTTNRDMFLERVNGDLDRGTERVTGFLNYVNTVDKAYLDKLRRKYGATTVDMFLHRAFE